MTEIVCGSEAMRLAMVDLIQAVMAVVANQDPGRKRVIAHGSIDRLEAAFNKLADLCLEGE